MVSSSLVKFPVSLPSIPIPSDVDPIKIASSFSPNLSNLNASHFLSNAVWRDVYALTGTLRTFYSASTIAAAWAELTNRAQAGSFALDAESASIARLPNGSAWVQAKITFETSSAPQTTASGFVALVPSETGEWKIWTLRTVLEQLKGQLNVDELEPAKEKSQTNGHAEPTHYDAIVIGGGMAGLSAGGRMKALGLSYVIVDKYAKVGDNWKTRYGSARCKLILAPSWNLANVNSTYGQRIWQVSKITWERNSV